MIFIARPSWKYMRAATMQVRPLYAAAGAMVIIGTLTSIGWRSGVTQFPQGGFYILISIVAAGCLVIAMQHEIGLKILAWTTPICIIVMLGALVKSAHGAGVDVFSQIAQALGGDPHALQFGLFRAAFRSVEASARSNVRHEVFGGLLIVMYIGIVASLRANYLRRVMGLCAIIVFPLVAISLSRSVMVGVLLTALVGLIRALAAGRLRILSFLLGLVALGSLPVLVPKLAPLFSAKYNSTGSYNTRISALDAATHIDPQRILLGGPLLDNPTQILFVDVLQRGGIFAGIAALVVEFMFLVATGKLVFAYFRTGSIALLATIGAAMHVLVRSVTGGGNLMDLVEWLGFALVIAVLYLEHNGGITGRVSAEPAEEKPARPAVRPPYRYSKASR
jgi:hypothetical protein